MPHPAVEGSARSRATLPRASVLLSLLVFIPAVGAFAADDSIVFTVRFAGAVNDWSALEVVTREGGREQSAATRFIPNRVDAELRYFPARFQGEIVGVQLEGIHVTDDEVVQLTNGAFREPAASDSSQSRLQMTRTFALDSRGRVTFFHGIIRNPGSGTVLAHLVWGYPPETSFDESDASTKGEP